MSDAQEQQSPSSSLRQRRIRAEERSIPFNCSMPYSEFVRLEQTAQKEGISRSELLRRGMQLYYNNNNNNNQ